MTNSDVAGDFREMKAMRKRMIESELGRVVSFENMTMKDDTNTIFVPRTESSSLEAVILNPVVAACRVLRGLIWKPRRILIRSRRAEGIADCGMQIADWAGVEPRSESDETKGEQAAGSFRVDPAWIPPEGFFVFAVIGWIGTVGNLF
jgi:hypothetical protein